MDWPRWFHYCVKTIAISMGPKEWFFFFIVAVADRGTVGYLFYEQNNEIIVL